MTKKSRSGIVTLSVITIISFLLYYPVQLEAANQIIPVGSILPLTGDSAAWGKQARDAISIASDEFNASPSHVKVFVNYQDTKADPKEAVIAANYLVLKEKVIAIIGDMTSATTLAAAPICERNKIIIISPVASSPKLSGAGKFVYRIWPSDIFEASFTANWLMKNDFSEIALVYLADDFGVPLRDTFRSVFTSQKGKIAAEEGYSKGSIDFRTLLLKVQGKAKAIYLISHYSDAAQFIRQARELGIDKPIIGTSDLLNDEFIRQGGPAIDGVFFPQRKGFGPEGNSPLTHRFAEIFLKQFNRKPGLVEAQAYDAAGIVFAAIANGARTGSQIKLQFDKLKDNPYPGVTGVLAFDRRGDLTFNAAGFRMGRITNGKFSTDD